MSYDDHKEPPATGEPEEESGWEIDGAIVQVPDGEYELAYISHSTGTFFGTPKLLIHFAIATGEYAGLPVVRYYNVKRLKGNHGKGGKFVPAATGHLIREMYNVGIDPARRDRCPISKLKRIRVIGEVRKVVSDSQREPIATDAHYSKVARLVRALPDPNWEA